MAGRGFLGFTTMQSVEFMGDEWYFWGRFGNVDACESISFHPSLTIHLHFKHSLFQFELLVASWHHRHGIAIT